MLCSFNFVTSNFSIMAKGIKTYLLEYQILFSSSCNEAQDNQMQYIPTERLLLLQELPGRLLESFVGTVTVDNQDEVSL